MSRPVTDADRALLRRALELAEGGRGRVAPNPLVGAVLERDGEVIGEGFHTALGDLHAEAVALEDCRRRGLDPRGATMLVTLEPCAHQGRQPPCADALLAAGIRRVVIASDDPTEKASGTGPERLRAGGVEVAFADGKEARRARLLNQPFRKRAQTGRPWVVLKSAASLDGFTASPTGDSKWISGPESRALVHAWRSELAAVAVGIGTALADDPLLTPRGLDPPPARQPLRVVFDSEARLPLRSNLVTSLDQAPVLLVVSPRADAGRAAALRDAGVEVLEIGAAGSAAVGAVLSELGRRGVDSVLLEGGAVLAGAFFDAGEIDELRLFLAPLLLGSGRPLLAASGYDEVAAGRRPLELDWQPSGADMLVRARLREW